MSRQIIVSFFGALLLALGGVASATPITLNVDTVISGDTPDGTAPWLTATFATVDAQTVRLTMTASGLAEPDFIEGKKNGHFGWGFMFFGHDATGLSFNFVSGIEANDVSNSGTTQASGLVGTADFVFSWWDHKELQQFRPGDSAVYDISSSSNIDPSDFYVENGKGYYSIAHIQGTSGSEGSAWIVSKGGTVSVPEPSMLGLFGLGLLTLGLTLRRGRNS